MGIETYPSPSIGTNRKSNLTPCFRLGGGLTFAHRSFKWTNLASHNAGVTVAVVGISNHAATTRIQPPTMEQLLPRM